MVYTSILKELKKFLIFICLITKIPCNRFLGQINFVKRFIPDFSQTVLPMQNMIRKNSIFKWGYKEKEAFEAIKKAIIDAPALKTPKFSNDFILYTLATERSYVVVLTQLNDRQVEPPIYLFSSNLQGAELNYFDVEKQAFAMFNSIKHFRPFLLKTHTKIIVPFSAVRQLLIRKEVGEKRANWVTTLQEYDIDIKPSKIFRGQGFCILLAGAHNIPENQDPDNAIQVSQISVTNSES